MRAMLSSIKADLLSRRLLPVFALLGFLALAALAYALLAGHTSGPAPTPATSSNPAVANVPGPAVSAAAPSTSAAVSETTSGSSKHHHGSGSRDPFKPLPETAAEKKANASAASAAGGSGSGSGSGSTEGNGSEGSGSSSGSSSPSPAPSKPAPAKAKPKPKPVYETTVLFGQAPTPEAENELTPYTNLKRLQPLPSATDPRIAYMGVSPSGKGAIFSLVSEAILHGSGICVPSPAQCEAIDLGIGKSEELEYFEADGQTVLYRLQVKSITKSERSASSARKANAAVSAAGRHLVGDGQVLGLVHMRYSASKGVLVLLDGRSAFGAKAGAARHHGH
jgi:hypothetical protein